jgi:hypothetical protein
MERPDTISPEIWEALTEKEQEYLAEHERLHREFDRILKGRLRRSNEEMDAEVEQMLDEAGIER